MKRSSDSLRTRTSRRRWIRAISTSISSGDIVLSAIDTSEWPERKREGRQTEEKQCNKRKQTYKTFLNHSFIHSGHSFTVQPCLLGLNHREQVLHMAYFQWPHLIKALKCKFLIPLIWCHMCIGKFRFIFENFLIPSASWQTHFSPPLGVTCHITAPKSMTFGEKEVWIIELSDLKFKIKAVLQP